MTSILNKIIINKVNAWLTLLDLIRNPDKYISILSTFNADLAKTILDDYRPKLIQAT